MDHLDFFERNVFSCMLAHGQKLWNISTDQSREREMVGELFKYDVLVKTEEHVIAELEHRLRSNRFSGSFTVERFFNKCILFISFFNHDHLPTAAATFKGGYLNWLKDKRHEISDYPYPVYLIHWLFTLNTQGVLNAHLSFINDQNSFSFYAHDFFSSKELEELGMKDERPGAVREQWNTWTPLRD